MGRLEGIHAALDLYLEGFARRSGIAVSASISDDIGRLSDELEITLFRVVQEALTNIHRHSASRVAEVRLSYDSAALNLEIRDEGKGIRPEILQRLHRRRATVGVGLAAMRERVEQLGGVLAIDSASRGTVVRVSFPFARLD